MVPVRSSLNGSEPATRVDFGVFNEAERSWIPFVHKGAWPEMGRQRRNPGVESLVDHCFNPSLHSIPQYIYIYSMI